ncbi:MAG: phosphoribosyltransferase [Thermoanaerobaculia bacterium]
MTTETISPIFTAEQIAGRVRDLGGEIRRDAGDAEVFLLGILKGTALFLADLLRAIPGNATFAFIDVVRDAADQPIADAVEIDFLSFNDIRDRHVYLLKDVVHSGIIENYLFSQLRTHEPASLRLVALLDRPNSRTIDVRTDFRAFTIDEDGTWVGYGLEQMRRFGNLPYIGRVR